MYIFSFVPYYMDVNYEALVYNKEDLTDVIYFDSDGLSLLSDFIKVSGSIRKVLTYDSGWVSYDDIRLFRHVNDIYIGGEMKLPFVYILQLKLDNGDVYLFLDSVTGDYIGGYSKYIEFRKTAAVAKILCQLGSAFNP